MLRKIGRKAKKVVLKFLLDKSEKKLISFKNSGYLNDVGWLNSFNSNTPVNKNNEPLPWVTYSFIDFISERLNKSIDMFEYGSGFSTLFYSSRVNSVTTVEHNEEWYNKLKSQLPKNVTAIYRDLDIDGKYCRTAKSVNKKFDIIVIDGRERVNCVKNSVGALKDNGIIILDDSERKIYQEAISFLNDINFKKIDFWGFSPGLFYKKCTTILYQDNNCINL